MKISSWKFIISHKITEAKIIKYKKYFFILPKNKQKNQMTT